MRCTPVRPLLFGGHQQQGRRPGTEPVALAVGFAAALDARLARPRGGTSPVVDASASVLKHRAGRGGPNIPERPGSWAGVPHVLNLSFPGCRGDALLMALDLAGVCCSTGSACSSGSLLPSPVLTAMGIAADRLRSALRFSFGFTTTEAEINEAAAVVVRAVHRARLVENEHSPPEMTGVLARPFSHF